MGGLRLRQRGRISRRNVGHERKVRAVSIDYGKHFIGVGSMGDQAIAIQRHPLSDS